MAKILFGAGVADARNKLGGHVFSKNRNGAYLRMKVSPTQPRTPEQNNVRASFTNFAKAWGGVLTDAQRAAWTGLAAVTPIPDQFGNPQIVTGLNMYVRVNRNLFTIGVARMDNAPGDQAVTGLASMTIAADSVAPSVTITFTPTPLPALHHLVVLITPNLSAGRSFFTPLLKIVFADPAAATASPKAVIADWTAKYGALVQGAKLGCSCFVINSNNGAASQSSGASCIIT